ncbi:MAG: hypothetical protein GX146_01590 [Myxococcales bacterium]|nr:hypothetical protein [Myxococcales bacterium]
MNHTAEMLLADNLISLAQATSAERAYEEQGGTIGQHLVTQGALNAEALARHFARRYGMSVHRFEKLAPVSLELAACIPKDMAWQFRVFPVSRMGDNLVLGITDPGNGRAINTVLQHTRLSITPILFSETDMTLALSRYYPPARSVPPPPPDRAQTLTFHAVPDPSDAPPDTADGAFQQTVCYGVSIEDAINAIALQLDHDGNGADDKPAPIDLTEVKPAEAKPAPTSHSATAEFGAITPDDLRNHKPAPSPPSKTMEFGAINPDNLREDDTGTSLSTTTMRFRAVTAPSLATPSVVPDAPAAPATTPARSPAHRVPTEEDIDAALDSWDTIPPSLPPSGAHPFDAAPRQPIAATPEREIELLRTITKAESRGAVIEAALSFLRQWAGRAVFLAVQRDTIRGVDIQGDYTHPSAIRSFWIPFSEHSTLGRVAAERRIHLGPLGSAPSDTVFKAALGGRTGQALILPIAVHGRTLALLYADHLSTAAVQWPRATQLTELLAIAFAQLLQHQRASRNPTNPVL